MAKINPSSFVQSLSGKLSYSEQIVYRTRNGRTSAYVLRPSKVAPSEAQINYRIRFSAAAASAKAAVASPDGYAHWKAVADDSDGRFLSPYAAALSFFLNGGVAE